MERTISALDTFNQFSEVLQEVAGKGNSFLVEQQGKTVAALVPIELYESYERWKQGRNSFFKEMQEISDRINLSPKEADDLANEAVQAVRRAK